MTVALADVDPFAWIEVSAHVLTRVRDRRLRLDEQRIREDVRGALLLGRISDRPIASVRARDPRPGFYAWAHPREFVYLAVPMSSGALVVVTVLHDYDRRPAPRNSRTRVQARAA